MKILNVCFTERIGGLEKVFLDYSEVLAKENFEVICLLHKNSKIAESVKGKFYRDANFSKYDPFSLLRIRKIVSSEKPDIIITHGNRAHYLMKKTAGGVPVIGVCHGYSFGHIKNCDYLICVSRDMKKKAIEYGYPENRAIFIPNHIKIPTGAKYEEPLFRNPPKIGALARLEKEKGIDCLISALAELKKGGINFKCYVAGEGPELQNLSTLSKNLGLEGYIEFLGWVKDTENFYRGIDIICLPSLYESFGLVALEAFLHSKPLVSSFTTGPAEIITDGFDALAFPPGDYLKLAYSLERVIKDSGLAAFLSKNGFNEVYSYDMVNLGKKLSDFIKGIKT